MKRAGRSIRGGALWGIVAVGVLASAAAGQVQLAKLLASDGARDDYFGVSIAIDNGVVAVGAYLDDDNGDDGGDADRRDGPYGLRCSHSPDDNLRGVVLAAGLALAAWLRRRGA